MYIVLYTNPNNVIRTEPYRLETRSKVEVRALVQRARQYPGSMQIESITKTTKSKGTVVMSTFDF